MAIINYPSSAFHFTDSSANEIDIDSTHIVATDALSNESTITPAVFQVNDGTGTISELRANGVHFYLSATEVASLTADASGNVITATMKPTIIVDGTSSPGSTGQVLTSTVTGIAWSTAAGVPNLADVLAVATAGDGGNQPISNVTSVTLADTVTSLSAGSLALGGVTLGVSGSYLTVSTAADLTTPRTFNLKYLPIVVDSVTYYIQLFV